MKTRPDAHSYLCRRADPTCWPDHTLIPFDDDANRAILDHALTCLILVRGGNLHDPGATISTLVTILADAQARLPDAVAKARDHGYTWSRIADRLGSTIPAARRRYADYARLCRQLRLFD
jgi:hypothetical protein